MSDTVQRWSDEDARKRQATSLHEWDPALLCMICKNVQTCCGMSDICILILNQIFHYKIDLVAILQSLGKILIFESYVKQ